MVHDLCAPLHGVGGASRCGTQGGLRALAGPSDLHDGIGAESASVVSEDVLLVQLPPAQHLQPSAVELYNARTLYAAEMAIDLTEQSVLAPARLHEIADAQYECARIRLEHLEFILT